MKEKQSAERSLKERDKLGRLKETCRVQEDCTEMIITEGGYGKLDN